MSAGLWQLALHGCCHLWPHERFLHPQRYLPGSLPKDLQGPAGSPTDYLRGQPDPGPLLVARGASAGRRPWLVLARGCLPLLALGPSGLGFLLKTSPGESALARQTSGLMQHDERTEHPSLWPHSMVGQCDIAGSHPHPSCRLVPAAHKSEVSAPSGGVDTGGARAQFPGAFSLRLLRAQFPLLLPVGGTEDASFQDASLGSDKRCGWAVRAAPGWSWGGSRVRHQH